MPSMWIILTPLLLLGALTIVLLLAGKKGPRPPDGAWNGSFYSNPADTALVVPKRYGIGYTLNFGNPWSWAVIVVFVLSAAIPFILIAVSAGHLPIHDSR
jgi:hypothetical protein